MSTTLIPTLSTATPALPAVTITADVVHTRKKRGPIKSDTKQLRQQIRSLKTEIELCHKKQYAIHCSDATHRLYKPHHTLMQPANIIKNQQYIDCYYNKINTFLPIFNQADFNANIANIYTTGVPLPYVTQYCCVIATGALFLNNLEYSTIACTVTQNAVGHIFDSATVDTLRAVLLLALYYIGRNNFDQATIYLSLSNTLFNAVDHKNLPELMLIIQYLQGLVDMHNLTTAGDTAGKASKRQKTTSSTAPTTQAATPAFYTPQYPSTSMPVTPAVDLTSILVKTEPTDTTAAVSNPSITYSQTPTPTPTPAIVTVLQPTSQAVLTQPTQQPAYAVPQPPLPQPVITTAYGAQRSYTGTQIADQLAQLNGNYSMPTTFNTGASSTFNAIDYDYYFDRRPGNASHNMTPAFTNAATGSLTNMSTQPASSDAGSSTTARSTPVAPHHLSYAPKVQNMVADTLKQLQNSVMVPSRQHSHSAGTTVAPTTLQHTSEWTSNLDKKYAPSYNDPYAAWLHPSNTLTYPALQPPWSVTVGTSSAATVPTASATSAFQAGSTTSTMQ